MNDLNNFCPGNAIINNKAASLAQQLSPSQNLQLSNVTEVRSTLASVDNGATKTENVIGKVKENLVFELVYRVPVIVIAIILMLGTLIAGCGKCSRGGEIIIRWFFLPLFVLLITLSWIFACIFGAGAILNTGALLCQKNFIHVKLNSARKNLLYDHYRVD